MMNHSSTYHEILLDLESNLNETEMETIYYDLEENKVVWNCFYLDR